MGSFCRILNVGPDPTIRRALLLLHRERLASIRHADAASIAFEILAQLPVSDLPDLIIIPLQLPVVTCFDFIGVMRANPRCRAIPILVWGCNIPPNAIEQIYAAGAACLLASPSGAVNPDELRSACRSLRPSQAEAAPTEPPDEAAATDPLEAIAARLVARANRAKRNAKLGALFLWTGAASAVLWFCSFLELGTSFTSTDLTPLSVYGALAYVGISLMSYGR